MLVFSICFILISPFVYGEGESLNSGNPSEQVTIKEDQILAKQVNILETYTHRNHMELEVMQESIHKLTNLVQNNAIDTRTQIKILSGEIKDRSIGAGEENIGIKKILEMVTKLKKEVSEIREQMSEQTRNISSLSHTVVGLSNRVDSFHPPSWIYYPPGTHDNRVRKHYPEYNATFVNFGQAKVQHGYKRTVGLSFAEGLEWCNQLRLKENREYNGFEYRWTSGLCYCNKKEGGNDGRGNFLHYHFN